MITPQARSTGSRCLIQCASYSHLIDPFLEYRMGGRATTTGTADPDDIDSSSSDEPEDPEIAAYVSFYFRAPRAVASDVDDVYASHTIKHERRDDAIHYKWATCRALLP